MAVGSPPFPPRPTLPDWDLSLEFIMSFGTSVAPEQYDFWWGTDVQTSLGALAHNVYDLNVLELWDYDSIVELQRQVNDIYSLLEIMEPGQLADVLSQLAAIWDMLNNQVLPWLQWLTDAVMNLSLIHI